MEKMKGKHDWEGVGKKKRKRINKRKKVLQKRDKCKERLWKRVLGWIRDRESEVSEREKKGRSKLKMKTKIKKET